MRTSPNLIEALGAYFGTFHRTGAPKRLRFIRLGYYAGKPENLIQMNKWMNGSDKFRSYNFRW